MTVAVPGDTTSAAARATGYVVLSVDPAVPLLAVDFWQHSEPWYRAVVAVVERLAVAHPATRTALDRLRAEPTTGAHEDALTAALTDVLAAAPVAAGELHRALTDADREILIGYRRGPGYRPHADPVSLDEILARSRPAAPPPGRDPEVLVVIPLMDRAGGARVRNLLACLLALRDQTIDPGLVRVTVVETDALPRWRDLLEPLVDDYVFGRNDADFNKSWAVNLGVAHTSPQARQLCLLDADILGDRDFLARNHARLRDGGHDSHLPYRDMLCLDPAASERAIRERVAAGRPDIAPDTLRSLVLRDPPGACVWTLRDAFDRVGGFDERYVGWGGEDDDMLARLTAAGTVRRYADQFLHLAHPRPQMQRGGQPFNAHLPPLSWRPAGGYGRLSGPRSPSGADGLSGAR